MHPQSDPPPDRTENLLIKSQLLRGPRATGKVGQSHGCDQLTFSCLVNYSLVCSYQLGGDGGVASSSHVPPFLSIEQNTNNPPQLGDNGPSLTDSRLKNRVSCCDSPEFEPATFERLEF